jgi:Glycosyl hydrolases family 39
MKARHIMMFLFLLGMVACIVPKQSPAVEKTESVVNHPTRHEARIHVNPSHRTGTLPTIYRAGSYLWYLPDPSAEKALDKFLLEQRVGTIGILLDSVLESSKSMEDLAVRLSQWDTIAKKVAAHGGEVLIEIWGMPLWLSSNPSGKIDAGTFEAKSVAASSPPKDFIAWSNLVYGIVDHFNNKLQLNCRYQIWMEPDLHWLGTEEEYLKLYKYSVMGAKKADPNAKIGGPGLASWDGKFSRKKTPLSDNPSMYNFMKYCSENGISELGLNRLPIDFIVWHLYNADPFNPFTLSEPAVIIRKWLAQFGYEKSTPLIIGEWNIWQEKKGKHPYFSPEHDTEITASYIVAMVESMQKAGIASHMFTTLFEVQFTPREPEYTGNFGLFTKNKIIKPSYNAFHAISMLGKTSISTKVDDEFLVATGTMDNGNIVILIANFFPYGKMNDPIILLSRNAPPLPYVKYGLVEILGAAPMSREDFEKIRLGTNAIDKLKLTDEMKKDLKTLVAYINKYSVYYKDQEWRRSSDIRVSLEIENIPFQNNFGFRRYAIDSKNGNSYAVRKKIEDSARKGIRNFNEWPEIKLHPVEEKRIDSKNYGNIVFDMNPYSVHVIVLSK